MNASLPTPGEVTMEVTAPMTLSEARQRSREKCPRAVFCWSLIIMITVVEVLATSCLSFFLVKKYLEPSAKETCVTHWAAAPKDQQKLGENEILAWEVSKGDVQTGSCTNYNDTDRSLVIRSSGVYFIFVQVMLLHNWKTVTFHIDGRKIIYNSVTAGNSNTVYFGSTCDMRDGAKISVKLNTERVRHGETETFISLFKL